MTDRITVFADQPRYRPRFYSILRINILLKFIDEDLALLTNGAWENLLDRLHQALIGFDRRRSHDQEPFKSATRENVREAQRGLLRAFNANINALEFEVAKQTLTIVIAGRHPNEHDGFFPMYRSDHFPTYVYNALAELLRYTNPKSILRCANDKCRTRFIPLRQPHKDKPAYCSAKCGNRMAAIEYRRRQSEDRKAQERERSHRAYKQRIQKTIGKPTKVKRIPRKSK